MKHPCVLLAVTLVLGAGPSAAQTVALTGSLGSKALLVIDGVPRTVAVGATADGVRLVSLADGRAVVDIAGRRQTLVLGGSQVMVGHPGKGGRIVLSAGDGGHYITAGQINGTTVQFMVDTGATSVAMTVAEANRIGLNYQQGQRIMLATANGNVPAHVVRLNSVRIGEVEVSGVDAVVAPREMPYILLGNSFLSRFQMKTENNVLTLERRF